MFYFLIWKRQEFKNFRNLQLKQNFADNKQIFTLKNPRWFQTAIFCLWETVLKNLAITRLIKNWNYLIFKSLQCNEKIHSNKRSLPKGKLYNVFWETPNPIYIFQAARLWYTGNKSTSSTYRLHQVIYRNIQILGIGKDGFRDYPFCFPQKNFCNWPLHGTHWLS